MKSITIKLDIQPEIFNATREFMDEKGLKIEQELCQSVSKLYAKHVPAAVRKYIEKTSSADVAATSVPPIAPNESSESGSKETNSDLEHHVFDPAGSYGG